MAQANHATTPRRRAVQSAKCEKSPAEAKPSLNGVLSRRGHGIAGLAENLADLQTLKSRMNAAHTEAKNRVRQHEEKTPTPRGDDYRDARQAEWLFEDMDKRAFAKICAIEELVIELEPKTADETLTLAAIFWEALDSFVVSHCDQETPASKAAWDTLERAIKAIIRGLIANGASSPVLDYYLTEKDLSEWEAVRNTAGAEASGYLAKNGDASEVRS